MLTLLQCHPTPVRLREAGRSRLVELIRPEAPRMAQRLIDEVFTSLDEQTVVVAGTETAATVITNLASSLRTTLRQRSALETEIETLLEAHPLSRVLTSMPGTGVRTAARILIEVGDGSAFASAAHLASYAGLSPATRASGTSIKGEQPSKKGNKQLKRALFLSAFRLAVASALTVLLRPKDRPRQTP